MTTLLLILVALQVKHFVVDFPLQTRYQWSNKGTWGHPGGILHAGLHAIGTGGVIWFFTRDLPTAAILAAVDMVVHYHIDWAKMRLNHAMGWAPTTHPQFWVLLGLDQFLHQLTYAGFLFWLV